MGNFCLQTRRRFAVDWVEPESSLLDGLKLGFIARFVTGIAGETSPLGRWPPELAHATQPTLGCQLQVNKMHRKLNSNGGDSVEKSRCDDKVNSNGSTLNACCQSISYLTDEARNWRESLETASVYE